jgi:hypothetical protein
MACESFLRTGANWDRRALYLCYDPDCLAVMWRRISPTPWRAYANDRVLESRRARQLIKETPFGPPWWETRGPFCRVVRHLACLTQYRGRSPAPSTRHASRRRLRGHLPR